MADKAHRLTDEKLEEMEKRLSAIYSRAEKTVQKKMDDYAKSIDGNIWEPGVYGWDGRFIIPFDFKFNEMWGIADEITDGDIKKPKRNQWLDILYLMINKVFNFFIKS